MSGISQASHVFVCLQNLCLASLLLTFALVIKPGFAGNPIEVVESLRSRAIEELRSGGASTPALNKLAGVSPLQ